MSKPLFTKIDQVAVVVNDAKATIKYLSEKFGIGPWVMIQFGDAGDGFDGWASIEDCVCEGDPIGTYCIDCCCCSMPNGCEIEVISPRSGSSIFARYLDRHGPGVQHISIVQDDFDETIARMKAAGFENGQLATVASDETCAFIEHLKVLGTYLELHRRPEVWNPPKANFQFYPGPTPEDKPATPPAFSQIEGVNIVTTDLEAALDILEKQYDIGPWEKTVSAGAKTAMCPALNIDIKIEQPLDKSSADYALAEKNGADIKSFTVKQINPVSGVPVEDKGGCKIADIRDIFGAELEMLR